MLDPIINLYLWFGWLFEIALTAELDKMWTPIYMFLLWIFAIKIDIVSKIAPPIPDEGRKTDNKKEENE